jgi:hypothetical protein
MSMFGDAFMIAVDINDLQLVQVLTVCGKASLGTRNSDGSTALHLAAAGLALHTLKYLISRGVDINAQDDSGRTPLHLVVENEAEQSANGVPLEGPESDAVVRITQCLMRHGADPTIKPFGAECCIDIASPQMRALLVARAGRSKTFLSARQSSPLVPRSTADSTAVAAAPAAPPPSPPPSAK